MHRKHWNQYSVVVTIAHARSHFIHADFDFNLTSWSAQ